MSNSTQRTGTSGSATDRDETRTSAPLLAFENVTKRFPGVTALADVTFQIQSGECHAIVGENGAGKSTLGKIVAGIHHADGGRILLHGQPQALRSPLDAARAGISIVHQELAFCPNLSVAENLFLGAMPSSRGRVRWRRMYERAGAMLANVGLDLDPRTPMGALSTGHEQLVQIALAVDRGASALIMDEPTSSLSQRETQRLFEIVEQIRRAGITIIYISHRLEEVQRLSDRVTVLRDGRFIQTLVTSQTSTDEIVRLMIGRPVDEYFPEHVGGATGRTLLRVTGLTSAGRFEDISFSVSAGEVVGLAGLVGAGRSELARSVFGIDRYHSGFVEVCGRTATIGSAADAIRRGVGLVPEDRKRQGLVLSMTCRENLTLPLIERLKRWLLLDHRRDRALAQEYFDRLRVRAPGVDAPIAGLSGGNQQKIALAKWMARRCPLLILDEPTRGVDVGAKAEIHALIGRLAKDGHAILLISSELPEILNLSTRIIVLADGRITGQLRREQADQAALLRLMTKSSVLDRE
jgi:ABC-type sugar transport system ATPase subunit